VDGRISFFCPVSYLIESQNKLQTEGFDDDAGLDETIKKLESDLKKARKKEVDGDDVVVSRSTFSRPQLTFWLGGTLIPPCRRSRCRCLFVPDFDSLSPDPHLFLAGRRGIEGEEEAKTYEGWVRGARACST
jgi:hypothetical protein